MRRLIFNLHLYAALTAGAFIVVLGITGSIMAFEPEIFHLLHYGLFHVKAGNQALALAEIGARAQQTFPKEKIQAYALSTAPDLSYQVAMENHMVFVNQYTGEVLGAQGNERQFLDIVHQLHLRLLWRGQNDPGGKIMAAAGTASLFLLISGLYLWWPLKRFTIRKGSEGRRWWLDLHSATGIAALLFLLVATFTGVMIGFEKATTPLLYRITGTEPAKGPKVPAHAPDAKPIPIDQALSIARAAVPGAAPIAIGVPTPAEAYQVRLRFPEDLTPGGRSRALIDQYTGQVLFAEGSRTAPAGARMVTLNRALHTGDFGGIPGKIVMSLASLAMAMQMISGGMMWWKRTRVKRWNIHRSPQAEAGRMADSKPTRPQSSCKA